MVFQLVNDGVLVVLTLVLTIMVLGCVRSLRTHVGERVWVLAVSDVLVPVLAIVFGVSITAHASILWEGAWLRVVAVVVGLVLGVVVWCTRRGVADGR